MMLFWRRHKFILLVLAYLLVFFVPIFFSGGESLDYELLVGIGLE